MPADPFSDILHLVNAQSVVSGGFTTGLPWALRFPAPDKIKFFGAVRGDCWLFIEGQEAPVLIQAGDVFLLSAGRSYVLASDPAVPAVDAKSAFAGHAAPIKALGGGEDWLLIGGHVLVDPVRGGILANVLPPLIHVRAGSAQAPVLQWLLDQTLRECAADLPGAEVASTQLAHLMLVQLLRAHLQDSGSLPAGWLRAAGDKRIAPALRLMHADPGKPWHLDELAKAAAMSRTTFAQYFKEVAGVAPMAYLTAWRMHLAGRALREEKTPVSVIAYSLGYTSESAFSNAFKRVVGNAPRHYRSAHAHAQ